MHTASLIMYLAYQLGARSIAGPVAAIISIAFTAVAAVVGNFVVLTGTNLDTHQDRVRLAGIRAKQTQLYGSYRRRSVKQRLVRSAKIGLPALFVLAVMFLYVTVVFSLFNLYRSSIWKVFVTILAFGVKIIGNKLMLRMVTGSTTWAIDWALFNYEYVSATLLRVLQLFIPDVESAQVSTVLSSRIDEPS